MKTTLAIILLTTAQASPAPDGLIKQILIEQCSYNSDCGDYDPARQPPWRKPV